MRASRTFARFAYLLGAATQLASAPASAQLWVLSTPEQPAAVQRAELAYALGDGGAATWLSLRVQKGPVAVLAALGEGARAEAAIDGWFIALEDSASPNIVPPKGSDDCRALRPYVRTTWPRSRGLAATELRLARPGDVVEALAAEGLPAPTTLPAAEGYVLWLWPDGGESFTTRTLRVAGGAEPLELSAGSPFPVSVSALGNGPLAFEAEAHKGALPITYVAGERPSADYALRLADFLDSHGAPLVEARASSLLFDWSIYADVVTVAPLVQSYAEQAGGELGDLDTRACREQLSALREAGAPPPTACAEALDAGLALGLLDPGRATLQRFQLLGGEGVRPSMLQAGGEASQPFLRAQSFDGRACPGEAAPPIVYDPPVSREPGASPAPVVVVEETVVIVEEEPVELSCGGQPQPDYYEDDDEVDCSSDTSSSSDEDCSSDTSSSSDEDCSSDTSSSSDTAGGEVDCASDSSTSSSSDDGCSGDTSSESGGYDGDTCTGSAAPQAETSALRTTGVKRTRPARLKTSAWALGFVALVLPIRRRKRRPGAGG